MIHKNITQIGDPLLVQKIEKITDFDSEETKNLIQDLTDTMREKDLVGIAANQIGANKSIFLTEIRKTKKRNRSDSDILRVFINPKITHISEETEVGYEGCGSVAYSDFFGPVRRASNLRIEAFDESGKKFEFEAREFLARIIQHEMDHLEGTTFIEKIEDMKKCMSSGEFRKKIGK